LRRDDSVGSFVVSDRHTAVVALRGEYDSSMVSALADLLASAMAASNGDVVVDLAGVRFMDSATVRVFEHAADFLANRSRRLVLPSPSPFTRRLLELCGASALTDNAQPDATDHRPAVVIPIDAHPRSPAASALTPSPVDSADTSPARSQTV
jgi:anti-anti-sigma factor